MKKIATDTRLRQRFVENYVLIDLQDAEKLLIEEEEWESVSRIIETMPTRQQQIFKIVVMVCITKCTIFEVEIARDVVRLLEVMKFDIVMQVTYRYTTIPNHRIRDNTCINTPSQ